MARTRAPCSRRSSPRARQFCLHLHHEAGLGQLLLQPLFLLLQPGDAVITYIPPRPRQPGQRARITSPTPLHDMTGIQPLAAQQRTLLTVGCRVVGGQNVQLVLRGKPPSPSPRGHLRIETFPSSARHPPRIYRGHVGEVSIPALGSLIIRGRVPQPRLAERVPRIGYAFGANTTEYPRRWSPNHVSAIPARGK